MARDTAADLAQDIRERFDASEWLLGHLRAPISKLELAKEVASDIAGFTLHRLRSDAAEPSDHLTYALNRIVVDAANELIRVKMDVAVCIANQKRLLRTHDSETSAARDSTREAAIATEQAHHDLAKVAVARAVAHLEVAKRAEVAADELRPQIERLKSKLRSFKCAIDDATLAVERLRTDELLRDTQERVERQTRRIQHLVHVLETISALQHDLEGSDDA